MSFFSNIQDNRVLSKYKGKIEYNLDELSSLTNGQLTKLIQMKGQIPLVMGKTVVYVDSDVLNTILKSSTLKEGIEEYCLDRFLKGKDTIKIGDLDSDFIEKNKDKLLIGKLPDELLERYYKRELSNSDIIDNIELFSSIDAFNSINIANFCVDSKLRHFLSKLSLNDLKDILKYSKPEFMNMFENSDFQVSEKISSILNSDSEDVFKDITNYMYDLNCTFASYGHKNEQLDEIGKHNIFKYLKENMNEMFFDDRLFRASLKGSRYDVFSYENNHIAKFERLIEGNFKKDDEVDKILDRALLSFRIAEPDYYKMIKVSDKTKGFFLPEEAPKELKEKYYYGGLSYEDVMSNLKYFSDTNISLGFLELNNALKGRMSNEFMLELLKNNSSIYDINIAFKGVLKKEGFESITSFEKCNEALEKYYKDKRFTYQDLLNLEKIGIKFKDSEEVKVNMRKSGLLEKSFMNSDVRMFTNEMVDNFGMDIIRTLSEYHASNAMDVLVRCMQDKDELSKMKEWFAYLKENELLDKSMIIKTAASYDKCGELITSILDGKAKLTEEQVNNLKLVLNNENEYKVTSAEELASYKEHKAKISEEKFKSDDLETVKTAIYGILFDNFEGCNVIKNINNLRDEYLKSNYIDKGYLEPDLLATIAIIKDIGSFQGTTEELRSRYEEIIKIGTILNVAQVGEKMDKAYGKVWNGVMFHPENQKDIKKYQVKGVDGKECKVDITGKPISPDDVIDVYELDKEPFELLVHAINPGETPDVKFVDIGESLYENPSVWNGFDGATTLSTSLITDKHIEMFGAVLDNFKNKLYYGFNHVADDSVFHAVPRDAGTAHGGGVVFPDNAYDYSALPSKTISNGYKGVYNEVVLRRKSNTETNDFDGKIQPTCILCFDGTMSEESRRAAQYFRVPIYMINRKQYLKTKEEKMSKYEQGKIDTFDFQDIDYILSSPWASIDSKIDSKKLCLQLCDDALSKGIINQNEYLERINYIFSAYSKINNDMDPRFLDDLRKRVDGIRKSMKESETNEIRL